MGGRDPWTLLRAGVAALGVPVDSGFEPRVRLYLAELARWNQVGRLTGYRDTVAQVLHLVLESLLFLPVLGVEASPLLDIGTGAGVPGLVLKLARPGWRVALVDANRRRTSFLRHALRCLELGDTPVYHARSEALAGDPALRGAFATVTMRAVTAPPAAAGLARPFLAPGGRLVLPLGTRPPGPRGRVVPAHLSLADGALSFGRRFLIIDATDLGGDVPRGTAERDDAGAGGRQPEGRGREDDDGR